MILCQLQCTNELSWKTVEINLGDCEWSCVADLKDFVKLLSSWQFMACF